MGPRRAPIQLSCESLPVIEQIGILASDADLWTWKEIKTECLRLCLLTCNTQIRERLCVFIATAFYFVRCLGIPLCLDFLDIQQCKHPWFQRTVKVQIDLS